MRNMNMNSSDVKYYSMAYSDINKGIPEYTDGEFENFAKSFESKVEQFLKNTELDSFNESYFDRIVEKYMSLGEKDLIKQRSEHEEYITDKLLRAHKAEMKRLSNMITSIEDGIKKCKEKIKQLEKIINKGTSLSEGDE